MTQHILDELFEIIESRKNAAAENSYVASLFEKGTAKISQKVGEEAVEAVIEAMRGDKEALKNESADLLFHLMVLWADQEITPQEVFDVLTKRLGVSGLVEKEGRSS